MTGPFTPLDLGLGLIALVSGLLAMYRGLTREVLSLASWALAGVAAFHYVFYQREIAQDLADRFFGGSLMMAQIGGAVLIFLVVLVIVHLLTSKLSDKVLDSHIGIIDRTLGFMFGVARGFLLVVIGFVFTTFLVEEKNFPPWVKDAQSLSMLQETGKPIQSIFGELAGYVSTHFGKGGQQPAATTDDGSGQSG